MHSITSRQNDGQTDNIIMPIADHTACSVLYERLKIVGWVTVHELR